jgi:hypothetical protein
VQKLLTECGSSKARTVSLSRKPGKHACTSACKVALSVSSPWARGSHEQITENPVCREGGDDIVTNARVGLSWI